MINTENKKLYIFAALSGTRKLDRQSHIIVSTYNRFLENHKSYFKFIHTPEFRKRLDAFGFDRLYIVLIKKEGDLIEFSHVDGSTTIYFYEIPIDIFFSEVYMYNWFDGSSKMNKELSSKVIFVFADLEWKEIVLNFKRFGFLLSGGSTTKRHTISTVQHRLSQFICLFEGNSLSGIVDSFKLSSTSLTRVVYDLSVTNEKNSKMLSKVNSVIKITDKDKIKYYKEKGNNTLFNKTYEFKQSIKAYNKLFGLNIPLSLTNYADVLAKKIKLDETNSEIKEKNNNTSLNSSISTKINNDNEINSSKDDCFKDSFYKTRTISNFNFNNQKREYHTNQILYDTKDLATSPSPSTSSSTSTSTSPTSTLSNPSYVLTYLDKIEDIIQNNKHNLELAQKEIEESWLNIIEEKLKDEKYLLDRNIHRFSKVIKEAEKTLDTLYKRNHIKTKFPLLHNDLNKIEMLIITYTTVIAYYKKMKGTNIGTKIGDIIFFEIYKTRIKNERISKDSSGKIISFLEFKKNLNFNSTEAFKLGFYFIKIFLMFPHNLFEMEMEDEPFNSKGALILNINPDYIEDIKENIIIHPSSLPMVCKPKLWTDNEIGGFLSNKEQQVSIITGSHFHDHKISNKEALYKTVNTLNSNKFSINTLLLEFLENEGSYLLASSTEGEERDKVNLLQQIITLRLANVFKNIPFYLSVHADWRSRIYTQSFFLSYQGGDLSSALINFYEGQTLTETGKYYFYIYGANNHNDNNISKDTFINRIQWLLNNYDKIINLDPDLILKAENRFIFTAFCLNMRELHRNPKYKVSSPIFLDATCSGIQHLAALMQDLELGTHVNLTPHSDKDKPEDLYSEVVEPINKELNRIGEEEVEYYNLSLVKFDRKTLKQSIMTKVYNVTHYGIAEQLKSKMDLIKVERNRESNIEDIKKALIKSLKKQYNYFYQVTGKNGEKVMLTSKDIFKIAKVINDQIFVLYPSLNNIYSYFIDISKLMVKLELPISWFTPNGLKFKQKYLKSKETKLAIRIFGKINKIVLREKIEKIDKNKQIQAIIPNIIHSLDATHLINVINNSFNNNLYPIITIHDCFGTLPNFMDKLNFLVKKEFILLYSQDNFLEKFHNRMIETLKDNNIKVIYESDKPVKAIYNEEVFNIPSIPKLGKLDLEKIIESRYMIS